VLAVAATWPVARHGGQRDAYDSASTLIWSDCARAPASPDHRQEAVWQAMGPDSSSVVRCPSHHPRPNHRQGDQTADWHPSRGMAPFTPRNMGNAARHAATPSDVVMIDGSWPLPPADGSGRYVGRHAARSYDNDHPWNTAVLIVMRTARIAGAAKASLSHL
jgi:hypothetical protein